MGIAHALNFDLILDGLEESDGREGRHAPASGYKVRQRMAGLGAHLDMERRREERREEERRGEERRLE